MVRRTVYLFMSSTYIFDVNSMLQNFSVHSTDNTCESSSTIDFSSLKTEMKVHPYFSGNQTHNLLAVDNAFGKFPPAHSDPTKWCSLLTQLLTADPPSYTPNINYNYLNLIDWDRATTWNEFVDSLPSSIACTADFSDGMDKLALAFSNQNQVLSSTPYLNTGDTLIFTFHVTVINTNMLAPTWSSPDFVRWRSICKQN